jgi:hypothetical protein
VNAIDRTTRFPNDAVAVKKYEKPTAMTRRAPTNRCWSSFMLKPNTLDAGGLYETVYLYDGVLDQP